LNFNDKSDILLVAELSVLRKELSEMKLSGIAEPFDKLRASRTGKDIKMLNKKSQHRL